jgi:hypothetical protein
MTTHRLSLRSEDVTNSEAMRRLLVQIGGAVDLSVRADRLRSRQWYIHSPAKLLTMDIVFEAFASTVLAAATPAPIYLLLTAEPSEVGLAVSRQLALQRQLLDRARGWTLDDATILSTAGRPAVLGSVNAAMLAEVLRQQYEHPGSIFVVVGSDRDGQHRLTEVLAAASATRAIDVLLLASRLGQEDDVLLYHSGAWDVPGFAVNLVGSEDRLRRLAAPPLTVAVELPCDR